MENIKQNPKELSIMNHGQILFILICKEIIFNFFDYEQNID